MSQPPDSTDDLQFTNVEPSNTAAPAQTCILCHQPIASEYFAIGNKVLCPACSQRVLAAPTGSKFSRLAKATLMGLGAGLVGALIWFLIRRVAHLEIGLVAILVGYMVGKAVRKGSGNLGGRGYQILAVVLTYSCIAANYMPDIFEEAFNDIRAPHSTTAPTNSVTASPREHLSPPRLALAIVLVLVLGFGLALAAPFLAGAHNLIGLLIIAFALWQAWKMNAHRPLPITGPYRLGTNRPPLPGVIV